MSGEGSRVWRQSVEQSVGAECRIRVYKYNMHEGRDGMGKREAKRGCGVGWS